MASKKSRFSRLDAEKAAMFVEEKIGIECKKIKACGSLRRNLDSVGDLDFVVVPHSVESFREAVKRDLAAEILADGTKSMRIVLDSDEVPIQVDFMIVEESCFESAALHLTGSKDFNIICRSKAKKIGMRLSQYGLIDERGTRVASSEDEILGHLGMQRFIDPVRRSVSLEDVGMK